ncbi:general stress protein [Rothia halotolerans]|uniref:general stress protein n=1 Tax=Rothia halotolerans TaxID=405770 RepID=UPI00101CC2A1|nr:general stress protein [Rothia halotolerans]
MAISGNSRIAAARSSQLPSSVTVARYPKYEDAQGAVDLLAERGFPVQHLSIVGTDLRQVEHVVGTLSYAKVAASGAVQGLFYGILLALLLVLFAGDSWLAAFLTAVPIGVAFWMIFTVITYARRGSSRNFTAVGQLVAGTYELVCVPQEASEARRLLGGQASRGPLRPTPEEQPPRQPTPGGTGQPGSGQPGPGQSAPGQPASGQAAPGTTPAGPPAFGQREEGQPERRSQARDFQDLPDGRPRFGLREDEADSVEPSPGSAGGASPTAPAPASASTPRPPGLEAGTENRPSDGGGQSADGADRPSGGGAGAGSDEDRDGARS